MAFCHAFASGEDVGCHVNSNREQDNDNRSIKNGAITLPCMNVSGYTGHATILSWMFTTVCCQSGEVEEDDLLLDSEVRSEGAHALFGALRRLGLDPTELAYNPVSAGWPAQINNQRLKPT